MFKTSTFSNTVDNINMFRLVKKQVRAKYVNLIEGHHVKVCEVNWLFWESVWS